MAVQAAGGGRQAGKEAAGRADLYLSMSWRSPWGRRSVGASLAARRAAVGGGTEAARRHIVRRRTMAQCGMRRRGARRPQLRVAGAHFRGDRRVPGHIDTGTGRGGRW